jgi:protein-S-isoprenylcysteine O-methyltransferase Ste14
MIVVGALLHLVVVLLPLVLVGGNVLDPATVVFVAAASALYLGDAATMRWRPTLSRSLLDARAHRWATATGVTLLLLFWVCLTERSIAQPADSPFQLIGAGLMCVGATLRASAVRALGRHFRTEIDNINGELVRHGVYFYIRHPSETGLLASSLGAGLLLQSFFGLLVWGGVLLPVTLARLTLEERALMDRFGDVYRRYAHEVGALLPRTRSRGLFSIPSQTLPRDTWNTWT